MTGADLAGAAESFVGCRFRLHGRDPATGLDCIGLIEASLAAIGRKALMPNGYALRTARWDGLARIAAERGFVVVDGPDIPGDICLVRPAETQMHFTITGLHTGTRVEAHAGLRRVVLSSGPSPFPTIRRWRMS